jgi:hypothetical protein
MSDAEILAALDQTQEFAPGDNGGAPQRQYLEIGSDVEIAERVATDFRQEFGEVVFADGEFWRYVGTQWQPIVNAIARRAVRFYDGALYQTAAGEPAMVKLGKGRVDSVLHEMGSMLARPDFFEDAWVGINCASGFIAFDAAGQPSLLPHDPGHRCRHVLPGRWQAGSIDAEDPLLYRGQCQAPPLLPHAVALFRFGFSIAASVKPRLYYHMPLPFFASADDQHGALASLRGRHKPPHDGMRRMGRYNLSGVLAAGRRQDRRTLRTHPTRRPREDILLPEQNALSPCLQFSGVLRR